MTWAFYKRAVAGIFLAAACAGSAARGDTVNASLLGVVNSSSQYSGFTQVNLTLRNADNSINTQGVVIAGLQKYQQTSVAGPASQGATFNTLCIEITQSVGLSNPVTNYSFTPQTNLANAPIPANTIVQTVPTGTGTGMGTLKAELVSELWARDYADALTSFDKDAALQLAVWKVVYGDTVAGAGADVLHAANVYLDLNLADGQLTASTTPVSGAPDQAAIVADAQNYLNALTGTGPQASLVALTNPTYQDQITTQGNLGQQASTPLPASFATGSVLMTSAGSFGATRLIRRGRPTAA